MDQKTSFVSLLALVMGLGGFFMSLVTICVEWLFPSTKTQMPLPSKHHERFSSEQVRHPEIKPAPRLRRHSSFHPPMDHALPTRPHQDRQVSFSLDPQKFARGPFPGQSSRRDSHSTNESSGSSSCSRSSSLQSDGSATLVSSPVKCCDTKCSHNSANMVPLDIDIPPPFSNFTSNSTPSSPAAFLGKLPNMKKAFRRRGSPVVHDFNKSELLRSSMDSSVTTALELESPRSILMRPVMPHKAKSSPAPGPQLTNERRNSSLTFSNPFITNSRSQTPPIIAADNDVFSSSTPGPSSTKPFMRRFSSDASNRSESPKPRRTEPYAAPYNARTPIKPASRSDSRSQSHSRSTANRTAHRSSADIQHPSADLLEALDVQLSMLQQTQQRSPRRSTTEDTSSDSDASLDVPQSPTPVRNRTAWATVKRRVASDTRALGMMVR